MKTRTAIAAILALATAGAITTTAAFAKPPRAPAIHSYILLDRTVFHQQLAVRTGSRSGLKPSHR